MSDVTVKQFAGDVGIPADLSGDTGVGGGTSLGDDSAQIMPAVGFHHHMYIAGCLEARAQTDHKGRLVSGSAQVLFGQYGIHHNVRG